MFLPIADLRDYSFKCIQCGKCCKVKVITEHNSSNSLYQYNCRGKLTKKPETSTTFHHIERKRLINEIAKSKDISSCFVPYQAIFMKEHKIGFIYTYQVSVKEGGWCIFYDSDKKQCDIYESRPLICRAYPLFRSYQNPILPTFQLDCVALESEIKKIVPNIADIDNVNINADIKEIFTEEWNEFIRNSYLERRNIVFYNIWRDYLIKPRDVTPKLVKDHKLRDFSLFWKWAKETLPIRIVSSRFKDFKRKTHILNADLESLLVKQ